MINYHCALQYAARGWNVFPLQGKVPLRDSRGMLDATTDARRIKAFFKNTTYNIGIRTGEISNLTVIDIDCHGETSGFDSLRMLELEHPPLVTASVRTPSGGRHLYFQYIKGSTNRVAVLPGVDVRSDGGYVVAPYSVSNEGKMYIWENTFPPAVAPDWLVDLVLRPPTSTCAPTEEGLIPVGQRNNVLFRCICGLRYQNIPIKLAKKFALAFREECEGYISEEEVLATVHNIYKRYHPYEYKK